MNYNYLSADKYFVVNDRDVELTPIYISLPKPPPLELIKGYGDNIEDQFFEREIMPPKLIELEKRARKEASGWDKSRNKSVTWAKIYSSFWDILEKEADFYEYEIAWMKKMIWYSIHGYWFFSNGKPTFITGWHFALLNFWYDKTVDGYFDYRDRDRRKLLYDHYAYTSTETFAKLDKEGWAIKEPDGSYEMINMMTRVFYGTIKPKNRRSGETNQGLLILFEIIRKTIGGRGTIISKTGDDAEKYFKEMFKPSLRKYPLFLIPIYDKGDTEEINFIAPKGDYDNEGSEAKLDYTKSSGEKKNDGSKLYALLNDEQAKDEGQKVDVSKRWGINKLTMAQEEDIHGYCTNPSTVEEMNEGGEIYYEMVMNSCFYQRQKNGQTIEGLARIFTPAQDGLQGYIDPWGVSIIDDPTPKQIEDTKIFLTKYKSKKKFFYLRGNGALSAINNELDAILRKNTVKAKMAYNALSRKKPTSFSKCWSGTDGDVGWDVVILEAQTSELRKERRKRERFGKLEWEDGIGSPVYWVDDEEGPWVRTEDIPLEVRNKFHYEQFYNNQSGEWENQLHPDHPGHFTLGADPFGYRDELVEVRQTTRSKGGAGLLKEKLDSDEGKPVEDWDGFTFTWSFESECTQVDFDENMAKMCVYSGGMLFTERNCESTWRFFTENNLRGYLMYEWDYVKGKQAERPGYYLTDKSELFKDGEFYFNKRTHKTYLYDFLCDAKKIKRVKQLTNFDRLAGHLAALRGSKNRHGKYMQKRNNNNRLDLGQIYGRKRY